MTWIRLVELFCSCVFQLLLFFWFTQCNVTGPLDDNSPKCRFPLEVSTLEGNELIEWENWARYQLMSVGSDLLGKFSYLQYIVFAKMLLMKTKDLLFDATVLPVNGIRTISWWLTKLLLMHQRILDQRSSCLYDLLKLHDIDPSEFVSTFHLEAGLLEHIYRRVDSCRKHFESAEMAAGPRLSVTGVLGFRTVHQVEPKAQMVLVANTSSSNTSDVCPSINQVTHTHDSTIGVEAAMALNSLYPDGWFALGAAALKAYDQEEEQRGFYSIQGGPKVQTERLAIVGKLQPCCFGCGQYWSGNRGCALNVDHLSLKSFGMKLAFS
ncbi:hypothetical protein WN943_019912 [Citrus x changshan-huyou]